ncbi:unnamed protein product [Dovyalis caffra]|uniref:Uncharacterized protein n=1 Tax=Dovyalis caffra TaxID=77055 RepID=A0AAV1QNK0_9ROSI|nr:unnamed protein product [Dovyalis caffra]
MASKHRSRKEDNGGSKSLIVAKNSSINSSHFAVLSEQGTWVARASQAETSSTQANLLCPNQAQFASLKAKPNRTKALPSTMTQLKNKGPDVTNCCNKKDDTRGMKAKTQTNRQTCEENRHTTMTVIDSTDELPIIELAEIDQIFELCDSINVDDNTEEIGIVKSGKDTDIPVSIDEPPDLLVTDPWLLGGEFNTMLFQIEKRKGKVSMYIIAMPFLLA